MVVPPKEVYQPAPAAKPEITKADLLSLKKQVMEEVRKEFEEKARADQVRMENYYKTQLEQARGTPPVVHKSELPTHMIGQKEPQKEEPNDNQSSIFQALQVAQTQNHEHLNTFMRQSIQSMQASEAQSLNESAVAGAIAEYYMQGSQPRDLAGARSLDSAQMKEITEQVVTEKLNRIFDEFRADEKEFDAGYVSLPQTRPVAVAEAAVQQSEQSMASPVKSVHNFQQPVRQNLPMQ